MNSSGNLGINNESPIATRKAILALRKSFEAVKEENSTMQDRNLFMGAYFEDELVGFIRIVFNKTRKQASCRCSARWGTWTKVHRTP